VTYFAKLDEGIEVAAALAEINAHPEIWNRDKERIAAPNSPHRESSDVWLRYRARREIVGPASFAEPHFAEFYPAWHALPAIQPIVFHIMGLVKATYLGGILITRIRSGHMIYPHIDGGWHAKTMTSKVYCILAANDRCSNHYEDEECVMAAGEAWSFQNDVMHWVLNDGDTDRIALIVTARTD
jgi:hypothetical protein